jgi:hypothetical protein
MVVKPYEINSYQPPDRDIGNYWSQVFADMMNHKFGIHKFDKAPSPVIILPNSDRIILADVILFEKDGENYYCEVKHKQPTKTMCYGLEQYRFNSLVKLQEWSKGIVLYVIHNYSLNGGKFNLANDVNHWEVSTIKALQLIKPYISWYSPSLVNGVLKKVPICYWNIKNWDSLARYLLV